MPKAVCTLPPADFLRQCFDYDTASGELRWRHRPQEHFRSHQSFMSWNGKWAGRIAGRLGVKGYWQVCVNNRRLYAARIIYKMHHDIDPEWIDHADRNRLNNRLANLRSVSMQENNRNMIKPAGKTGYVGVRQYNEYGRKKQFTAVIRDGAGKRRGLGFFYTPEEAHAAYQRAAQEIFGEFSPFPNT
jgi:hypothetical protein